MAPTRVCVKNAQDADKYIDNVIKNNTIVVFSKSYCPYCTRAKDLLKKLHREIFILELDELEDNEGEVIQNELRKKTRQGTVPNVFINGRHVGGCDDTMKLHKQGKLVAMINDDN